MADEMCPSLVPSATFGMPDPVSCLLLVVSPGGMPGMVPCQAPHPCVSCHTDPPGTAGTQHSLAVTPLRGKPGSPSLLCDTGESPSRSWGSFSVAFSLTFNENKQAGMAGAAGALPGRVPGTGSARLPAWRRLCTGMARAGAVPAVMPFPGEKQHRVKSRVVATAHGSRQDGTLPVGGESRGDASCPGEVGDVIFMQVLQGWGGDGLCCVPGCWLPTARGTGTEAGGHLGWFFTGCFSEPAQPHLLQLLSQRG